MLETTKEERARWLALPSPSPLGHLAAQRLCRDVNALEEALQEITREFAALIVAADMTLGVPSKPNEGRDHAHDVLTRAQAVLAPKDREEGEE